MENTPWHNTLGEPPKCEPPGGHHLVYPSWGTLLGEPPSGTLHRGPPWETPCGSTIRGPHLEDAHGLPTLGDSLRDHPGGTTLGETHARTPVGNPPGGNPCETTTGESRLGDHPMENLIWGHPFGDHILGTSLGKPKLEDTALGDHSSGTHLGKPLSGFDLWDHFGHNRRGTRIGDRHSMTNFEKTLGERDWEPPCGKPNGAQLFGDHSWGTISETLIEVQLGGPHARPTSRTPVG